MKLKKIRKDLLIICLLILIGLVLWLALSHTTKSGETVEIRVSGTTTQTISLSQSGNYEIKGANGSNLLVIENGKAHMEEASCPDGVCMNMGEIDSAGQSIICLPNEIVVEIKGSDDNGSVDVR